MIDRYIDEFQNPKFAYIYIQELDNSEPGHLMKCRVYFHPVG